MGTNELPEIHKETLRTFQNKSYEIVQEVVNRSMKYKEDIKQHGEHAREIITAGIKMTTDMLFNAMSVNDVGILEDQLKWAKKRLSVDGVSAQQIYKRFTIYHDVVNDLFEKNQAKEINGFLQWMIQRQQEIKKEENFNESL